MAPKRRSSSSHTKARGKRIKNKFTLVKEALMTAAPQAKTTRSHCIFLENSEVHEDYDCILHQVSIAKNDSNYFLMQILTRGQNYYCYTRWGRAVLCCHHPVYMTYLNGEVNNGQSSLIGPWSVDTTIQRFKKIFKEKTKNNWSDRENFVYHSGKYTMIEVDTMINENVLPCTLDKPTEKLIELIFDEEMLNQAMFSYKMMPLGKLSNQHIAKGFEALEEIEAALKNNEAEKLEELSNKFFRIIPQTFGISRPTIILDEVMLLHNMEMLLDLADIEVDETHKAESEKAKKEAVPHPLDQNYQSLKCNLNLLDTNAKEYKIIQKYMEATGCKGITLENIWKVDRKNEAKRFRKNDALENRKLLWHGTDVAVVAAILKNGLRIMPHSGKHQCRGIYFASENSTSLGYVYMSKNTGLMFLSEVALGKEHTTTERDCTLQKPPPGYDSVVARGSYEPDPSKDIFLEIDGKQVAVPQGIAIPQSQYDKSYYYFSEYIIFRENQCRIRYLVELRESF